MVPLGIDNSVIERCAAKGRSGVEVLNELMRHLFVLQVKYEFVLAPFWISTVDNSLSDHLSRGREQAFLHGVHSSEFLLDNARPIHRMEGAGRVVYFDRPSSMSSLRQLLDAYSSNNRKDGPARGAGVPPLMHTDADMQTQLLKLPYSVPTLNVTFDTVSLFLGFIFV